MINLRQSGVILFTGNFEECVVFYRDKVGLPTLFAHTGLVCLDFGGAYLMVETNGVGQASVKTRSQNPCVLRFNVDDVAAAAEDLRSRGVVVDVQVYDWGMIGVFVDPDGNRCELKDH